MSELLNDSKKINTSIQPFLKAKTYHSGFADAHDTYNAITTASDGKTYYVLCSESMEQGGQMFVYDPFTDQVQFVADLTEVCGEKGQKAIPQGKSHVEFYEYDGKLYFATHVGIYEMIGNIERLPQNPPEGISLYPGGHIISYDLANGSFEDLGIAFEGEGIVTMTMDTERGQVYGLTWPNGYFVHYDITNKEFKELGPISAKGEGGIPGDNYRVLCRSLLVDPGDGCVYSSTSEGFVLKYDPDLKSLQKLEEVSLCLDYFGTYDYRQPGSMGYNWRKILWCESEGVAYGVHGNSGYLFRFNPKTGTIDIVERITSEPSRRSGMFDQFTFGYLGFQLGLDGKTIYYLTGGPIYEKGKRLEGNNDVLVGSKGVENLHLVTYHIGNGKYTDHGPVFYEDGSRPSYVNSLALDYNGSIFTIARFENEGKTVCDLIKIDNIDMGR